MRRQKTGGYGSRALTMLTGYLFSKTGIASLALLATQTDPNQDFGNTDQRSQLRSNTKAGLEKSIRKLRRSKYLIQAASQVLCGIDNRSGPKSLRGMKRVTEKLKEKHAAPKRGKR